jgi:ferric-dicitrate binding protein FerR (iron transport regulator)
MSERETPEDPGEEAVTTLLRLAEPGEAPPAERTARVRAAVEARWRDAVRARRLRRRLATTLLGLAAAAVIVVVAVSPRLVPEPPAAGVVAVVERAVGGVTREDPERRALLPGAEVSAGTVVETRSDGGAALRLADGASLRVDGRSRVRLISATVVGLEQGGVYLDSGPRGRGGLEVRTPLGVVRDVGTQFEVRLAADALGVRVREGRVRIETRALATEVERGQAVTVGPSGHATRERVAAHGAAWDWASSLAPPFEIEGRPLQDLLEWVSRETGRRVRLAGVPESVRKQILHGSLEGLGPLPALDAALPACGLAHRLDEDAIVVEPGKRR